MDRSQKENYKTDDLKQLVTFLTKSQRMSLAKCHISLAARFSCKSLQGAQPVEPLYLNLGHSKDTLTEINWVDAFANWHVCIKDPILPHPLITLASKDISIVITCGAACVWLISWRRHPVLSFSFCPEVLCNTRFCATQCYTTPDWLSNSQQTDCKLSGCQESLIGTETLILWFHAWITGSHLLWTQINVKETCWPRGFLHISNDAFFLCQKLFF